MQAVVGECTCKYPYEGTWKHPLFHLPDPLAPVMTSTLDWVHDTCRLHDSHRFNEIVANRYDPARGENIPWHTDRNRLLSEVSACRLEWLEF